MPIVQGGGICDEWRGIDHLDVVGPLPSDSELDVLLLCSRLLFFFVAFAVLRFTNPSAAPCLAIGLNARPRILL